MNLDIGSGENRHEGFISMDKRNLEGIDIVHDLEIIPYPVEDESCEEILAVHIMEHIKPWLTVDVFNELWRIMKDDGLLHVEVPYAGSPEFWQDPTHCNGFIPKTFSYFDPRHILWSVYKPKTWYIEPMYPKYKDANLTCNLRKVVKE
jgi:predicted SAM-dependent methyltransferase